MLNQLPIWVWLCMAQKTGMDHCAVIPTYVERVWSGPIEKVYKNGLVHVQLFNTFHFFLGSDKVSSRRPFQFLEVRGWQAWVESDRRGNRVAWRFVLYMWYHMFKVRICPKLWEAFEDS